MMNPLTLRNCPSTLTRFIGSMATVNEARGVEKRIVLREDFGLSELIATSQRYDELCARQSALDSALRVAINERNALQSKLTGYMTEFSQMVRVYKRFPAMASVAGVLITDIKKESSIPKISEAALIVMAEWQRIHALVIPQVPNPFLLSSGATLAQFIETCTALKACEVVWIAATAAVKDNRLLRRQLIDTVIRPRLVEYRQLIRALYPHDHVFVLNLPNVYPVEGSTPEAVTVSGGWSVNHNAVLLQWTPCPHPELDHYEVRASLDATYYADDDKVVAVISKDQHLSTTTYGLDSPGSFAQYRVYAVTTLGRERGSRTIKVVRPESIAA